METMHGFTLVEAEEDEAQLPKHADGYFDQGTTLIAVPTDLINGDEISDATYIDGRIHRARVQLTNGDILIAEADFSFRFTDEDGLLEDIRDNTLATWERISPKRDIKKLCNQTAQYMQE
jgi:hypothetical protein